MTMPSDNFDHYELSSVAGSYNPRMGGNEQTEKTEPIISRRIRSARPTVDRELTEITLPPSVKIDPAVGWVVCIAGVDKGRAFRLVKGNNPIGRPGNGKTYAISLSDQEISRKGAAAVIVYNEKSNQFFIAPGDLTINVNPYLNDEILLSPKHLEERSKIEIGGDVLVFVPFCCDKFKWKFSEEEKAQKNVPVENIGINNIVRCPNGHNYNAAFNETCPYCEEKIRDNDPDGTTKIVF